MITKTKVDVLEKDAKRVLAVLKGKTVKEIKEISFKVIDLSQELSKYKP